jgi:hypothetical protein
MWEKLLGDAKFKSIIVDSAQFEKKYWSELGLR